MEGITPWMSNNQHVRSHAGGAHRRSMAQRTGFQRHASGLAAEETAERHYRTGGAEILARRHRTPEGELDLIACDRGTLVFVEVKRRKAGLAGDSPISPRQWRRLERAAAHYLATSDDPWQNCRFDVALIDADGRPTIFENAHLAEAA